MNPDTQHRFDKTPQVFYKPLPNARDYYDQKSGLVDSYYPEETGGPLRRRSPSREPKERL